MNESLKRASLGHSMSGGGASVEGSRVLVGGGAFSVCDAVRQMHEPDAKVDGWDVTSPRQARLGAGVPHSLADDLHA